MPITLDNSSKEILIENMTVSNPDVFNFLCDKDNREEWIERALIFGCAGLKQMILTDNVDYVEKKFNDFLQQARDVFKDACEAYPVLPDKQEKATQTVLTQAEVLSQEWAVVG